MATTNAQTFTIGGVTHQVEDTTARAGVASLQTALASLQSALDTLMGTDDITDEIDTYNEIKEFLDGFDVDDPNLSEQLTTLFTNVNDLVAAMPNKASATQVNNLQTAVSNLQTALQNVYTKSQTYNKDEVDAKVAIVSGTYQQAVTRSQTDTGSFMWMLIDTIGNNTIRKPIFHVGNGVFVDMAGAVVEIGEVPNAPTFTMSDETSTPNEFPVGGGTVAISAGIGETIYYTTNGDTPTTSSTEYTEPIQVTDETTIKAIAVNRFGSSEVASQTFTIAVDHKFQFKIALTGDNSTEYVPVTDNRAPRYHFTVDWGDGTSDTIGTEQNPVDTTIKSVAHAYTGTAGTEFIITLRGTSIPVLCFGDDTKYNRASLIAVLDNTLACDTAFVGYNQKGAFYNCTNLTSLSANALQNNTHTAVQFEGTKLSSIPDGLFSHLTKSSVALTDVSYMFKGSNITANITASQMAELKSAISSVTDFGSMFYGFGGSVNIPDDFFDGCAAGTITSVWALTHTAGSHVTGDAKKLYDSLLTRITEDTDSVRKFALGATGLSNRNQVPTTWGGSMS